ncbi:MAG: ATP-binding protein [Candidatus Helarchaeota archaeon]
MDNNIITNKIITKELKLIELLKEVLIVGGIYNMGYKNCYIITNDIWKKKARGIPRHCFLLATVMEPNKAPIDSDDEEIILLRVIGPAKLPSENELINVRSDAMREIITDSGKKVASDQSVILDVLTRNEIQFSGIEAKVLGTFYEEMKDNKRVLKFGSDLDNFYSSSRYKVYKPYGYSLSTIVSFIEGIEDEDVKKNLVQIGRVRYSSTKRRSNLSSGTISTDVLVKINIEDLISMKTAIFGMTRLGKSNTMKIIATAVFQYGLENDVKIGQLLFDPTGEYANINPQDQTALSQLGENNVVIFKYGGIEKKNERPLKLNFFNEKNISEVWSIIRNHVLKSSKSDYFKTFASAELIGPDSRDADYSEFFRAERRRSALYATLIKAGFEPNKNFKIKISANKKVCNLVNNELSEQEMFISKNGRITLTKDNILTWWDRINTIRKESSESLVFDKKNWVDNDLSSILEVYGKTRWRTGYNILIQLRTFHTPNATHDYLNEIINELLEGKIVIIDISLGNENVLQYISERIINGVLGYSSELFIKNKELPKIQVFIEEAHRLFNRTKFEKPESTDPYVRLAKEAAKYKIGLIYATQEVTSVDSQVLANTSNWIVTHLNNHKEVNELSKYYDFKDFYDQIIKAEDVGFARIKTKSGRYIIPVQIDLFSKDRIDAVHSLIKKNKLIKGG